MNNHAPVCEREQTRILIGVPLGIPRQGEGAAADQQL